MPDIKLPDGSIARFPDGMSDKTIEAVLQAQFATPPPTPQPAPHQRFGVHTTAEEQEFINIVPKDARTDFFSQHRTPRVLRRPPQ